MLLKLALARWMGLHGTRGRPASRRSRSGTRVVEVLESRSLLATVAVLASPVSVTEGNSGAVNAVFTLRVLDLLGRPVSAPTAIQVRYATADGTAKAGSDYIATSGTVTIPKGGRSATVTVKVLGDQIFERNETFVLNLTPVNAAISRSSTLGTILNDDPVSLPALNTDAGTLTRLLIAESAYNAVDVKKGMTAMKAVVDNRLRNNPSQFNAPGAANYRDIITAPGQFQGFSKVGGAVVISSTVQSRIDAVINAANRSPSGAYAGFINDVLDVVNSPVSDPFRNLSPINGVAVTGGGYAWKTAGSTSPGGRFVAIPAAQGGVIAGNQFYTLSRT